MTSKFAGVSISQLGGEAKDAKIGDNIDVNFVPTGSECNVFCFKNKATILTLNLSNRTAEFARLQDRAMVITHSANKISYTGYYFKFNSNDDREKAFNLLDQMNHAHRKLRDGTKQMDPNSTQTDENGSHDISSFDRRTDDASASQYFQFYGYLSQQQNMMQDFIRTSTYQKAILDNYVDFGGKVVLDVGAGSGILSFFAVQAGARRVYAIEASAIAAHAETLIEANNCSDRIEVLAGKVEDLELPEKVDVIISEPMGYMLFNERMLETYLHAKKWLKPGGKMFPSKGILFITPFSDEALYMEQMSKCNFWAQTSFYAVDLSSLRQEAIREYFRQPVVDNFDVRVCLCKPIRHTIDFQTADETDLHEMSIPVEFEPMTTAIVHGLAFWFDVLFDGSNVPVWLSTAPTQPLTHWYQVRCLMPNPILVAHGQKISGCINFKSNTRQSYDIDIELRVNGTDMVVRNTLDLKNPFFRYTGQIVPVVPPGNQHDSPTDSFFNSAATIPAAGQAINGGGGGAGSVNPQIINSYSNTGGTAASSSSMFSIPQFYGGGNSDYYGNYQPGQDGQPGISFDSISQQQDLAANSRASNCNINNDTAGAYFAPMDDFPVNHSVLASVGHNICTIPVNPTFEDPTFRSSVPTSAAVSANMSSSSKCQ